MKKTWSPDRWTFRVDEISAGVYEAIADDQQGEVIRKVRYDPDEAMALVKQDVADITARRRQAAEDGD